jgi:predicted nuclease of restriction endonuclease-like (RecB) superfamily
VSGNSRKFSQGKLSNTWSVSSLSHLVSGQILIKKKKKEEEEAEERKKKKISQMKIKSFFFLFPHTFCSPPYLTWS